MRQYEVTYIIDPQLEDADQGALVERFQTLVAGNEGEVQHVDRWERRRLAYEIKGRREGHYVVMNFQGTSATEAELNRVMGLADGVLRHLIVKLDERMAKRAIAEAKAAAEAKARAAAEAEAKAAEAPAQPAPAPAATAAPAESAAPATAEAPAPAKEPAAAAGAAPAAEPAPAGEENTGASAEA
jgi:small subunit ribosomal protein S6